MFLCLSTYFKFQKLPTTKTLIFECILLLRLITALKTNQKNQLKLFLQRFLKVALLVAKLFYFGTMKEKYAGHCKNVNGVPPNLINGVVLTVGVSN